MLVPGFTFSSGRVSITAGSGQVPDHINQGLGFMDDGSLAVDTDAPSGSIFYGGFRVSPNGAIYGVEESASSPSHYISGLLVEATGRLIYDTAMAVTAHVNGNPIDDDTVFCTT